MPDHGDGQQGQEGQEGAHVGDPPALVPAGEVVDQPVHLDDGQGKRVADH